MRDATQIVIVLDRSGSMEMVREATIESFNQFMKSQKGLPGEASMYFVQFNTDYQVLFDKKIAEAPLLSYLTYQPNGSTALYDAVGHTIDSIGHRLEAMPESQRPNKVVFMVLTDGLENSSKRYSQQMIAERIEHQRSKYGWDFVFLGANQDAVLTARGLNIPQEAAMTFMAAPPQVRATMQAASAYVGGRRMGFTPKFSAEERAAAIGESYPGKSEEEEEKKGAGLFSWLRRPGKETTQAEKS